MEQLLCSNRKCGPESLLNRQFLADSYEELQVKEVQIHLQVVTEQDHERLKDAWWRPLRLSLDTTGWTVVPAEDRC